MRRPLLHKAERIFSLLNKGPKVEDRVPKTHARTSADFSTLEGAGRPVCNSEEIDRTLVGHCFSPLANSKAVSDRQQLRAFVSDHSSGNAENTKQRTRNKYR